MGDDTLSEEKMGEGQGEGRESRMRGQRKEWD